MELRRKPFIVVLGVMSLRVPQNWGVKQSPPDTTLVIFLCDFASLREIFLDFCLLLCYNLKGKNRRVIDPLCSQKAPKKEDLKKDWFSNLCNRILNLKSASNWSAVACHCYYVKPYCVCPAPMHRCGTLHIVCNRNWKGLSNFTTFHLPIPG